MRRSLSGNARRVGALLTFAAIVAVQVEALADDVVFTKSGARLRGAIIEESPTKGVRIKLLDGSIREIKASEVDRVQYDGAAPSAPSAAPPAPSAAPSAALPVPSAPPAVKKVAPGTPGRLRVRATCGSDPKPIAEKEGLVVEEILDAQDVRLTAASSDRPALKYDEATHTRVTVEPEYVDYELPPGPHRFRVQSKKCGPFEDRVVIEAGQPAEVAPKLPPLPLVDISFLRPEAAAPGDTLELRDADGGVVCVNAPCRAKIPAKLNGHYLSWQMVEAGATIGVAVPDPGDDAKGVVREANVTRTRSTGLLGPILIGTGVVVALVSLPYLFGDDARQCVYEGAITYTSTTRKEVGKWVDSGMCRTVPKTLFSVTFAGTISEQSSPSFYTGVGLLAVGGAAIITGAVLTALNVGGKYKLAMSYGQSDWSSPAGRPAAPKPQSSLRVFPLPNGFAGTF